MFFGNGGLESRLARILFIPIRTATKRASGGKAANNKTAGRRLGPKKGEGEFVKAGQIIWRQRGTKWFPGENAGIGRDHTIFASEPGYVRYYRDPFHAKRRFIGIALKPSERLPTPHFEPRRRRFGYTPIDNEEVAEFEMNFLTRKETQRLSLRDEILSKRIEAKSRRMDEYKNVIQSAGFAGDVDEVQLDRLDTIYQYICGGQTYSEATEIVDSQANEDFDLDLRTGRLTPDEHNAKQAAYQKSVAAIDALVAFSPKRKLVPVKSLESAAKENAVKKISELATPYLDSAEGTPANVVESILEILDSTPVFSSSEVVRMKSKFLRRPAPILVTKDNKSDLEKKAQNGNGEIRSVWDEKNNGSKRYYVPKGGKLIF